MSYIYDVNTTVLADIASHMPGTASQILSATQTPSKVFQLVAKNNENDESQ